MNRDGFTIRRVLHSLQIFTAQQLGCGKRLFCKLFLKPLNLICAIAWWLLSRLLQLSIKLSNTEVFTLFGDYMISAMGHMLLKQDRSQVLEVLEELSKCINANRYKNPQIQTSHWQPCVTVITGLTTGTTGGIITSAETAQKITALLLRQKKEFEKILYISSKKWLKKTFNGNLTY